MELKVSVELDVTGGLSVSEEVSEELELPGGLEVSAELYEEPGETVEVAVSMLDDATTRELEILVESEVTDPASLLLVKILVDSIRSDDDVDDMEDVAAVDEVTFSGGAK